MNSIEETNPALPVIPVPSYRIPPGVNAEAVNVRRGLLLAAGVPKDQAERFAIEAEQSQNAHHALARGAGKPLPSSAESAVNAINAARQLDEVSQPEVSLEAEALAKREAALDKREETLAKAEAKFAKKANV